MTNIVLLSITLLTNTDGFVKMKPDQSKPTIITNEATRTTNVFKRTQFETNVWGSKEVTVTEITESPRTVFTNYMAWTTIESGTISEVATIGYIDGTNAVPLPWLSSVLRVRSWERDGKKETLGEWKPAKR